MFLISGPRVSLMNGRQARRDCALSTDKEFVEDHEEEEHAHEHEEDHEEEKHAHENEEEHEEEGHLHEHEDEHENEEEHAHENNEEHEEEGHLHGHEEEHGEHDHDDEHGHDDDDDTMHIKIIALVVLFVESVIGSMVPISVGRFKGFKEVLSLLNCFAGGILMSTGSHFAQARFSLCRRFFIGIIHLIPHVVEHEADVDGLGDYPLGMVAVVVGFALVFFVENVLFNVHSHEQEDQQRRTSVAACRVSLRMM